MHKKRVKTLPKGLERKGFDATLPDNLLVFKYRHTHPRSHRVMGVAQGNMDDVSGHDHEFLLSVAADPSPSHSKRVVPRGHSLVQGNLPPQL